MKLDWLIKYGQFPEFKTCSMIWVGEPRECFNSYPYIHKSPIFANCFNRLMWFDVKFLIQHDSLTVTWFIVFLPFSVCTPSASAAFILCFLSRGWEMSLLSGNFVLRWEHRLPVLHLLLPWKGHPGKSCGSSKPSHGWFLPLSAFFFCTQREIFLQVGIHEDSQYLGRADPSGMQKGAFWVRKTAASLEVVMRTNLNRTSLQLNLGSPKHCKTGNPY